MSERISEDQVNHVAELAKLKLEADQLPYFTNQLDKIIGMFETLSKVNTEGVEPTTSVSDQLNTMREDIADNWNQREELLDNAPDAENGYIKVPAIIDESGDNE
ncbi:Asp-tRNA(Asn)/Glu-tRNA(Gln) amidotransferase subunit GatC [Lentilactobacillus kosonis]|uniref:Aspartyl/glutamyl-tRNA(Asn/Gln) amidotransferase subunit C n=1 Tax=Lentilactobacillus kosonis TaxID=2810561 RepID=A0A401FLG8_9LACO|nr:Asp-tRNA(Asn)/Glu-tRNA(Gln) amidotransferase subunit GatC [Lentilactobacillus kosonis]GAY73229.1 aspartyl-tRNA(Asn) amidotransferase subunit C [Lentilactobacillus kosonis]